MFRILMIIIVVVGMVMLEMTTGKKINSLPPASAVEVVCPPGLADAAADKDAKHAKTIADFEAMKKGSK